MKLLLAVDSIVTLELLLNEITARSWPDGTEARVLSIVEDGEVPLNRRTEARLDLCKARHANRS